MKKVLTRIRLVNWHYFQNETIHLNGSTLISGENASGKSTILDAIQLVLTTNRRRFNLAADDKGNRTLKGYVRCKIGSIGQTYLRKNEVITNVALEFYDEKKESYFVIGAHITSVDEESDVTIKWYDENGRFEDFTYLNGNKPARAKEFLLNGKKVNFTTQTSEAKEKLKRRLGNLGDRFFDVVPKSLAFKPMENVKDFINKFILASDNIDVKQLRTNIDSLVELETLIKKTVLELDILNDIGKKYDDITSNDLKIKINELMIDMAVIDTNKNNITSKQNELDNLKIKIEINEKNIKRLENEKEENETLYMNLLVASSSNESHKLIEGIKSEIEKIKNQIIIYETNNRKLNEQFIQLNNLLITLSKYHINIINKDDFNLLKSKTKSDNKSQILEKLKEDINNKIEEVTNKYYTLNIKNEDLDNIIADLSQKISELEKRRLIFPRNTVNLKSAIENEFINRGINSSVYILAEVLEISDHKWANAIEGYTNNQKFYLIVEPQYYNIALEIYHKNSNEIHSAGIINTSKLDLNIEINNQSLAYVVTSTNRYAKAYIDYLLGRVIRVDNINELDKHSISITPDCMLYQGYVVRKLDSKIYSNPYIGQNAYKTQLENSNNELTKLKTNRNDIREELKVLQSIINAEKEVHFKDISTIIDTPYIINDLNDKLRDKEKEYKTTSNDPTLIELEIKIREVKDKKSKLENDIRQENQSKGSLSKEVETIKIEINELKNTLTKDEQTFNDKVDTSGESYTLAKEKYQINLKTKEPYKIVDNFTPEFKRLNNLKENYTNELIGIQSKYNNLYDNDFITGIKEMDLYLSKKAKLEKDDIVRYESDLQKAKADCEQIFKEDFLAKMKNKIEDAKKEFRELNKALQGIEYGEDCYQFKLTYNADKESLYKMITSENNNIGNDIWGHAFENEYKDEMDDLFAKLTLKDDSGDQVLEEYTDYRNYLDYDIEITKRNGSVSKFSKIYREKSGGETQVPYYVAIAASFNQLYRFGNSIRLILLDEAFDKMDGVNTLATLDFFQKLDLQAILVTPSLKIPTISENIDTILTVIRKDNISIVEEYDFQED